MLAGFPQFSLSALRDGSFMTGIEAYLSDSMFDRDRIVEKTSQLASVFSLHQEDSAQIDQDLFAQVEAFAAEGSDAAEPAAEPEAGQETAGVTDAAEAEQAPAEADDTAAVPAVEEKDLSGIPDCTFTCTQKNGKEDLIYTFPADNIRRMIRVLNAYRAVLPEDGNMFFVQPPFPGIAEKLSSGACIGWDSDLEETINTYANDGVYMLNILDVLEQPLLDGEYLYFKTDHHWTPRAACYAVNGFMQKLGITPRAYDDFSFVTYHDFFGSAYSGKTKTAGRGDTLEILISDLPVKGYIIDWDGSEKEGPFLNLESHKYYAYLGGTLGPWRRFETGVDCARSCLVIGDSYDCVFVPFLSPYYETLHATDIRPAYYDASRIAWSISEYITENGIDDVYFVLSTASGVNTASMVRDLLKYL